MEARARRRDRRARRSIIGAAAAVGALATAIAGCGGSGAGSAAEQAVERQADLYAIGRIQTTFHEALSKKDIDLMMSVWAPNATVTVGAGQTLVGTEKIRDHWLTSKPFRPTSHLVAENPSYRNRTTANGDRGTLFFECHLIDTKTEKVFVVSGADAKVTKIDGRWLITRFVTATGTLSP